MKRISILGCTGVIGGHTLELVDQFPNELEVVAMAAGSNLDRLFQQIAKYRPRLVSVKDRPDAEKVRSQFPNVRVTFGAEGMNEVAAFSDADVVVAGVVGFAGMESTLTAVMAGKIVGLANKEAMITAGPVMLNALTKNPSAKILPIDSEHNAIFQCLEGSRQEDVDKILLTCSGGPFRNFTREQLKTATVDQALRHPNWVMGRKITIDSATLMNKGLEMIEARYLFNVKSEQVDVVIHPQSVIHSMVQWIDGAVTASLGETTMRGPIGHVLSYPKRFPNVLKPIRWGELKQLTFEDPDLERFPSLRLARMCLEREGNSPVVLNAANEIAVEWFLNGELPFLGIYETIEKVLSAIPWSAVSTVDDVKGWDSEARIRARDEVRRLGR